MNTIILVMLFTAVSVGLFVGGMALFLVEAAEPAVRKGKRVAAVTRGSGTRNNAPGRGESAGDLAAKRRKQVEASLKEAERKQGQTNPKPTLSGLLQQADWSMDPRSFVIMTATLGIGAILLFVLMGYEFYVALGAGAVAGFGFPRWFLMFSVGRRKKAFLREFANAIDVIVRGVKSGLPLNECLKIIAAESPEPVGPEFKSIIEGLKVGVTLEEGLRRMYQRMPLAEVNFFQIVLVIQQKTGGNLAEALSNLSAVLRDRKRLQGKIQALSSEAKASAGIIGSLPFIVGLLVYFTSPDYIVLLFTERVGNFVLLCSLVWMSMGIFVMKKMINFKF
ncbi:MAG: type II secretion system F family protein [Alphaproteobacteria bacterium]|nr:type II secretion system F family protein [Alphaproteobacteria bacterium]